MLVAQLGGTTKWARKQGEKLQSIKKGQSDDIQGPIPLASCKQATSLAPITKNCAIGITWEEDPLGPSRKETHFGHLSEANLLFGGDKRFHLIHCYGDTNV